MEKGCYGEEGRDERRGEVEIEEVRRIDAWL